RFRLAMRRPSPVERISGSRPRLPTRITLLTLPAMGSLSCQLEVRGPDRASYQARRTFLLYSYPRYPQAIRQGGRRKNNALTRRTQRTRRGREGGGAVETPSRPRIR